MREIEIKARVADKPQLIAALQTLGITLSQPIKQHDRVYARPNAVENTPEENWLRLRIENDKKAIFTLKRSVTGELDSIEHQSVVNDADEMIKIIGYLGYELFSDLTKTRQKGHSGDIELCLDEVEGLGTYIEAEKLCEETADGVTITAELWNLFDKLGIDKSAQETSGYDVLQRKAATRAK